jgi:hypothetical protein
LEDLGKSLKKNQIRSGDDFIQVIIYDTRLICMIAEFRSISGQISPHKIEETGHIEINFYENILTKNFYDLYMLYMIVYS